MILNGVYLGGTSDALKHYVFKQVALSKECNMISMDFDELIFCVDTVEIIEETISKSYVNKITTLHITTTADKYIFGIKDFKGIYD